MAEHKRHRKYRSAQALTNQRLMVEEFMNARRLEPDESIGLPLAWWGDMPPGTDPYAPTSLQWHQLVASDTLGARTRPLAAEWFVRATLAKSFDEPPDFDNDETVLCRVPDDLVPLVQVRDSKSGITFGVIPHAPIED